MRPHPTAPFAPPSRRLVALALLGPVTALLAGCVAFSEPVANDPEDAVDVSAFVGTWSPVPDGAPVTLKASGAYSLHGVVGDPAPEAGDYSVSIDVRLTVVAGRTIASVLVPREYDLDRDAWILVEIEPSDDFERLTLRPANRDAVQAAIDSGKLEATLEDFTIGESDEEQPADLVVADGQDVRAFLIGAPDVFDDAGSEDEPIVLQRVDPASPDISWSDATPTAPVYGYEPGAGVPGESFGTYATPSSWPTPYHYGPPTYAYPEPLQTQASGVGPRDQAGSPSGGGDVAASDMGGAAGEDTGIPPYLKQLVVALLAVAVLGLVAGFAIDRLRRSPAVGAQIAGAGDADAGPEANALADAGWLVTEGPATGFDLRATLVRYAFPALLVFGVAVGPILYLTLMLHDLSLPGAELADTARAKALLYGFAPFVLVFSVGALIGAAEVIATFPSLAVEALGTRWAALLVLINGLATVTVFSVATSALRSVRHPLAWSFAIAIGFIVLMRTRFVLARDLRGLEPAEGISIDTGWLYGRFQQMCRQRIDGDLMRRPRYAAERLLATFPTTDALTRIAAQTIASGDPATREGWDARLGAIRAEDASPGVVRARLAHLVVATSTPDEVRFLIEHSEPEHAEPD